MNEISDLIKLLRGPAFWLVVILVTWIGYQIGKEAKTNWFSKNLQQESSLTSDENSRTQSKLD